MPNSVDNINQVSNIASNGILANSFSTNNSNEVFLQILGSFTKNNNDYKNNQQRNIDNNVKNTAFDNKSTAPRHEINKKVDKNTAKKDDDREDINSNKSQDDSVKLNALTNEPLALAQDNSKMVNLLDASSMVNTDENEAIGEFSEQKIVNTDSKNILNVKDNTSQSTTNTNLKDNELAKLNMNFDDISDDKLSSFSKDVLKSVNDLKDLSQGVLSASKNNTQINPTLVDNDLNYTQKIDLMAKELGVGKLTLTQAVGGDLQFANTKESGQWAISDSVDLQNQNMNMLDDNIFDSVNKLNTKQSLNTNFIDPKVLQDTTDSKINDNIADNFVDNVNDSFKESIANSNDNFNKRLSNALVNEQNINNLNVNKAINILKNNVSNLELNNLQKNSLANQSRGAFVQMNTQDVSYLSTSANSEFNMDFADNQGSFASFNSKGFNKLASDVSNLTNTEKMSFSKSNIQENINNIMQKVMKMAANNMKKMEIDLNPQSLGKMKISLDLDKNDNLMSVHIASSSPITKDVVDQSLGRLKDTLQDNGINASVQSQKLDDTSSQGSGDFLDRHDNNEQQSFFGSKKLFAGDNEPDNSEDIIQSDNLNKIVDDGSLSYYA